MYIIETIKSFIGGQYRCPTGFVGRAIGERMVRQHRPETAWTVDLLEIKATDQILEIGFGAGKALEHMAILATQGYVAGIDLSHTMVELASRRNAQAIKAGRVELSQGNVMSLPFADHSFDKIFSIHTFYFWSDHRRAMQEIFRVLKPGGTLVLTLSTGKIGPDGVREAGPFTQSYLEEHLIPDMKQTGFTTVDLKHGPNSRQFTSVALVGMVRNNSCEEMGAGETVE